MFRIRRMSSIGKIGVAITTHNRHSVAQETVRRWKAFSPKEVVVIVVDDASNPPYPGADYRFEENVGISVAKNKCLELLEDAGVEHAFLADSDCYPHKRSWWKLYVESPEPHLSYQFLDRTGPVKLHDMSKIYEDEKHVAYSGQRGCLLYYHLPTVLPRVGGFDPIFGRALYEHGDLANRIHAAGLTTWRYPDVVGSHKYIYSLDEHNAVERTISQREQDSLAGRNRALYRKRMDSQYQAFVPYRNADGDRDVVITTFLTANIDPQRGRKWEPDARTIAPWLESMERGGWEGVVISDEMEHLPVGYEMKVEKVSPSKVNVYHQRWMHIYQYLRAHPEIRWVWCTDGSDVEVLRDPFEGMSFGKLYVGVENAKVNNPWMRSNHRGSSLQQFMKGPYGNSQLLNAGVVGGSRQAVMEVAHKIFMAYGDLETARFYRWEEPGTEIGDMAIFNKVVYENFSSRLVTGPRVTTEFKAYKDNGEAKFKHK